MKNQVSTKKISYRLDLAALMGKDVKCKLNCAYCHKDYFPVDIQFNSDMHLNFKESIQLLNSVIKPNSKHIKIHLSGRAEPLDIEKGVLLGSISSIHSAFPDYEIVMTTNGFNLKELANDLKLFGLHRVNVSIHHDFEKSNKVFEGISVAKQAGLGVSLNVILSEKCFQVLDKIIGFCINNKLNLKLFYELGKTDSEILNVTEIAEKKLKDLLAEYSPEYDLDRNRLIFKINESSKIILKLFEGKSSRPDNCNLCEMRSQCLEGCWESIRVTPWYIKPCGVRQDNVYFYEENSINSLKTKLISGSKMSS
jgi:molybdenum cofactor biosynthesis enzyme MoaA